MKLIRKLCNDTLPFQRSLSVKWDEFVQCELERVGEEAIVVCQNIHYCPRICLERIRNTKERFGEPLPQSRFEAGTIRINVRHVTA